MTTEDSAVARKLAEDALELDKLATKGPWEASPKCGVCVRAAYLRDGNYLTIAYLHNRMVGTVGDDDTDYDGDSEGAHNTEFIGKARQLVPDLATALLAALDREDELKERVHLLEVELTYKPDRR